MEELKGINISRVNRLDFKIPHRNWKRTFAEAFVLMSTAMPGEVISIYGPSHAGKTALLNELIKTVVSEEHQNEDEQHLALIEVDNSGGKASFSFKAFILELLEIIRHPVYSLHYEDQWGDASRDSRISRTPENILIRALIKAFKQRKTRFLVVDEAQDMKYAGKDSMAAAGVMDSLKTVAKKANVVLVLSGTYPMLQSINQSGHLENRKHDVHLPRYQLNEEDIEEFMWILANYAASLDLDDSLDGLQTCAELIYDSSFGCIGLVRALLYRASVLSSLENSKIKLSHIEKSMKSPNQLISVAKELSEGEHLLGLNNFQNIAESEGDSSDKTVKKTRKGKPFQRNPKRYPALNRG